MHSIVISWNKATYRLAKYLTKILQICCGHTSPFVNYSTDFIYILKEIISEQGEMFCLFLN